MRRNEHHNLLKTHILKGLLSQWVPWGVRRASELKLVANTYISERCVWLLRLISRALPLALCAVRHHYGSTEKLECGHA